MISSNIYLRCLLVCRNWLIRACWVYRGNLWLALSHKVTACGDYDCSAWTQCILTTWSAWLQAKPGTNLCWFDWQLWLHAMYRAWTRHICAGAPTSSIAIRSAESRWGCEHGKTLRELANLSRPWLALWSTVFLLGTACMHVTASKDL